jgi:DNA-binding protein H-NS
MWRLLLDLLLPERDTWHSATIETQKEAHMATLEQIQARMKKLQAQAEALIAKRAQAAVDQIRGIMLKHGLTTEDIEARAKARRERAKAVSASAGNGKAKASAAKGKLPPKYRDPKTGATWSGHARPPAWIKDAKDRTVFLINGAGAAVGKAVAGKAKVATKKTAAKKAAVRKTAVKKVVAVKKVAAKKVVASKKAVASKTKATKAAVKKTAKAAGVKTKARKPAAKKTAAKTSNAVGAAASSAA